MKFPKSTVGKWVATKGEKVIASDDSLRKLRAKIAKRKDKKSIGFDLVPRRHITGFGI